MVKDWKSCLILWRKGEVKNISSKSLVELAELALKNNVFEFDEITYLQKQGTAIGNKMAHTYAILFMDASERTFLNSCELKPHMVMIYR